jgi:hypothetical protein
MNHACLRTSELRPFILILSLAIGSVVSIRAEDEYEYAQALLERDGVTFQTTDLIERLIKKLETNAASRTDSKLIRALLDRKQARSAAAGAVQRATLLNHASGIYDEILAGPKTYAHYTSAEHEAAGLQLDRVRALKKSAEEDPANAKTSLAQAGDVMNKLAAQYKAQTDALYPPFHGAYLKYIAWLDANDPNREGRVIPREILEPLQKSFSAWLTADQKWLTARVEALDCLPEGDAGRKKLADEVYRDCESRLAEPAFSEMPVAAAWYQFTEGRAYSLAGMHEKADDTWDLIDLTPQQHDALTILKLVLRERIRMNMKIAKYDKVIAIVNKTHSELFDDDAGKEVLIDYMLALTRYTDATQEDYKSAVGALRVLITKETVGGVKNAWANEFARSLANVVSVARQKKLLPQLSGAEWYDAGTGFMLKADAEHWRAEEFQKTDREQAKQHNQLANESYESAAECLRSAISAVRQDEKNLAQRLMIEPKSWFALGACYVQTKDYSEAMVAYLSLSAAFGEKNRAWLPDQTRNRAFYTQPVKDSLAELEQLLKKTSEYRLKVYNLDVRAHPGTHIPPPPEVPEVSSDRAYIDAKNQQKLASGMFEDAYKLFASDPKNAANNLLEAAKICLKAAENFQAVPAQSASHEAALYGAASSLTLAHRIYASGKLAIRADESKAKAKELAARALEGLQRYEDHVAKTGAASDSDSQRRQAMLGQLLLFRCELCSTLSDWAGVLKNCDAYSEWQRHNAAANNTDYIAHSRFRALIELSGVKNAPDREERLNDAWTAMSTWRQSNPKEDAIYRYMLDSLSRRFEAAAADAAALDAGDPRIQTYYAKIADLEALRFDSAKQSKNAPSISDYAFHVFALKRAGRKQLALNAAKDLIDKFDPKATGTCIPDEPQVWQDLLAKMIGNPATGVKGVVRYTDLNKWERCRADHALLVDYMYDTPQGAAFPQNDSHRPEFDRCNMDLEKALALVQTIRRNYPDCQTLKPELGENGRAYLTKIEDEIDFRRKILETRRLISTLALEMSEQLKREGKQTEAQSCIELASEQFKFEREHGSDSQELQLRLAKLNVILGKYDDAFTILYDLRRNIPDHDALIYFEVMKEISCAYARQAKWKDAAEYPKYYGAVFGFDTNRVREHWPEMKSFLEECTSHIAK